MAASEKVMVCVAVTGNFQGKDVNPAIPYTPAEIADDVCRAWNAGASIVHIHARDDQGLGSTDKSIFERIDREIRDRECDIVIQHSMAPNPNLPGIQTADIDAGVASSKTNPPPEMVSLEISPSIVVWQGKAVPVNWNRLWAEKVATDLSERGIKPEIEIYNNAQIDDCTYLIYKGVLKKPYYLSFVVNMHRSVSGCMRYSPKHLVHLVDLLPADSMFTVVGVGYPTEFEATTLSLLLGGHVRVGLEDNIYLERDKLATNAELVAKIVGIARGLGREIASPDEAREMLGIPKLARLSGQ